MGVLDERREVIAGLSTEDVPTKTYHDYIADADYDGIGHRDRIILAKYLSEDPRRTIAATARLLDYHPDYFSTIASGYRPLTEMAARRINKVLDLDLWGVPRSRPKARKVSFYREEYAAVD